MLPNDNKAITKLSNSKLQSTSLTNPVTKPAISSSGRILILGDNLARGLTPLFINQCSNFSVLNIFKPNAKTEQVTNDIMNLSKSFTFSDYIILIAGSNNFLSSNNVTSLFNLFKTLKSTITYTNIIITGIPYNYEFNHGNNFALQNINKSIYTLNRFVYRMCENLFNFFYVDLNFMLKNKFYFSNQLCINKTGKYLIVKKICDIIKANDYNIVSIQNIPTIINNYVLKNKQNFPLVIEQKTIG